MRKILKFLTSRLMIVAPLIILQFLFFVVLFYEVALASEILPFLSGVALLLTVYVINRDEDPAYKIAWCIVILGSPIIGILLYALAGNRKVPRKLRRGTTRSAIEMDDVLRQSKRVQGHLKQEDDNIQKVLNYGYLTDGFPVYQNTTSQYFKSGEDLYPIYLEELKKAKRFILIEYFIIDDGEVWQSVLEILKQKVKENVKVRIIYDDFGSLTLPQHYDRYLCKLGIEAYRFNHVRPAFIIQMNNRDHRKITVIDNQVAFTGGINLADEYMNRIERFGYWKDSAIMLKGDAVWSFTVMFLGMLSYCRTVEKRSVNYLDYYIPYEGSESDGGYYQPFNDAPTDGESVGLNMHLNMVHNAKKYIYIDTPYLILNETMKQSLMISAKSGVDVRILVPAVADKKLVNQITKGFYRPLVEAGVRIYEFTPGFNHGKNFVMDDTIAIVGSVNTDYRSYYLHFENGVLMCKSPEIQKIRDDFLQSIEKSKEITMSQIDKTPWILKVIRGLLNIFIPLV